jgi:GTP-binding protein HflX
LEVDRRRVKQRIGSLERELKGLQRGRRERRKKRGRAGLPVVSIIGYTNAGKSTLLNRLTGSDVMAENRLFATLDPTTRRIRLESGHQVLLADTVGFIRNMPADIKTAFRSTLEELEDASLFLHVVDAASPYRREEIRAVEDILDEMELSHIPRIVLFNKEDLMEQDVRDLCGGVKSMKISALKGTGLKELKKAVDEMLVTRHRENDRMRR